MAMTPAQIAEQESQHFLDSQFAPLDTSGLPSLQKQYTDQDQLPDPRFAPLDDRGIGLGTKALKQGIEELVYDEEAQKEIARENPEILEQYQNQQAELVAREFLRQNPAYFRSPENWETLVQTLAFNALGWNEDEATAQEAQQELIRSGFWTIENLTAAFKALSRAGALEVRPDEPRSLTQHERRAIALQAASGDVEGAVSRYLLLRAPVEAAEMFLQAPTLTDALDEIADPGLAMVVREAVWFCWENGRPNYSPTPERRQFLKEYVAGRIPTARLLDEAWAACQTAEKDSMRAVLFQQASQAQPDAQPNLDELSDSEVESLYHSTLRKIAVDSRRPHAG